MYLSNDSPGRVRRRCKSDYQVVGLVEHCRITIYGRR